MTSKTSVASGSPNAQFVQAAGLFAQSMQRNSTLNRMVGKMPSGEGEVNNVLRKQTSTDMPVVRTVDLTRGKGDEVEFHFVQPVGAYPIMGSRQAEGKGTGISMDKARVRVNQARFPVDVGNTMTDMRSPVEFRKVGRPIAQSLMDSFQDQSMLVHMAGARGFHDNIEWRLPTADHELFAEMAINTVKAPTKNRHFIADGTTIKPFAVSGGEVDLQTTDTLDMDVVDSIRTMIESIALPPPAIKLPGDKVAEDSPLRCLMVSPAQYHSFSADPNFRQFQANALARASKADNHPLFLGEVGLWNGVLICKMPKPIRFYAGDTISYCASNTSETETTCIVPAAFGTTFAVDRALLLGGQALAQAFGRSDKGGMPYFWSEKDFDHGDKMELLIGAIQGLSKIRWAVDQGNGTKHFTDHGVIALDTAVPIIGARQ
ncbi:phage capsid family protein [Acidovorax sp. RAC01]|uniref:phage capsid family protein n=1 Tax=Acidovorax sp. RAC01 TaxID=1842533 RepID=UPI00083E880A|nr:DUF4043 family protein [Acidovorax sp. RAC01]AOG23106.1 hypothetical protein BSY15_3822 [Acidovorax sp. RAC01]AOG24915.1 hypothetical protein BSY15_3744 [Acidovorax sp. RAC01]